MTVTLNDQDISRYVQGNSFALTAAKSEVGQVLLNPIPSLVGIDTDGFWNPNNPVSVFFGINDLSVYEIKVYEDDLEIFNGFIENITRSTQGTATVSMSTELQKALSRNLIYSSAANTRNPAEIFMDICNLYKIKYDPTTALRSSSVYNIDSILVSTSLLTPNTTILSFFEALSQIGLASIYSVGNYLYYKVYETGDVPTPLATLENTYDSDALYILTKPIIANLKKDIPTGYSVTYRDLTLSLENLTATFGFQDNAFNLSGGVSDLITIDTLQTAVWIGEKWLEYLDRADTEVSLQVSTKFARDLQIGYPLRLEMNDGTVPMDFVVNELTKLNSVQTNLRGVGYGN